jgi:5-bromo-4-chloroindolyl phosphate hydrolysis protein
MLQTCDSNVTVKAPLILFRIAVTSFFVINYLIFITVVYENVELNVTVVTAKKTGKKIC